MPQYDLDLFLRLNAEWKDRPLVARPRTANDPSEMMQQSRTRASQVVKHLSLEGKRVLEVGCGRGYFVRLLTDEYKCEAIGLDVNRYDEWGHDSRFTEGDISDPPDLGSFDVIVSHAVWEHVRHPYTALVNQRNLLAANGAVYLYANLYRGAKASHRYREVFFPWPHLLFTDEVFEAFYKSLGRESARAAWVNYLTFSQYVDHFRRVGYGIQRVWASSAWWDEQFYQQHWDLLGRYPQWDLKHDFIHAVLLRDPVAADAEERLRQELLRHDSMQNRINELERHIGRLESSKSWRITAPLRTVGGLARRWR